jgi:hypothetical protein
MPKRGSNGYDREILEHLLTDIDDADERLASLKGEYMMKCKGPRGDIAAAFEAAKDAGVPVRAFKVLVKNRRLNKTIEKNVAKLEADDADSYDRILADLGDFVDLPLGRAALDRAKPPGEQENILDNLDA